MQLVRSSLLWASRNRTLETLVRSSRLMRPLVGRFMPGETMHDAIAASQKLKAEGTPVILTYLGENVTTDAAADESLSEYKRLLEGLRAAGMSGADAHISIKLTQFGWDMDRARATERVRSLCSHAQGAGAVLAIDMESSAYTESTVACYETLARQNSNVALCLQAYLHRTPQDVQRLLPVRPYIRLVKGAYREPASVAIDSRAEIDARYANLARDLIASMRSGARVAFGTHDIKLVETIRRHARDLNVSESDFEIQMLYGIQDQERRRLAVNGLRTRVLISYGRAWYAWFMRRLAEKPSNLLLVARSTFS